MSEPSPKAKQAAELLQKWHPELYKQTVEYETAKLREELERYKKLCAIQNDFGCEGKRGNFILAHQQPSEEITSADITTLAAAYDAMLPSRRMTAEESKMASESLAEEHQQTSDTDEDYNERARNTPREARSPFSPSAGKMSVNKKGKHETTSSNSIGGNPTA